MPWDAWVASHLSYKTEPDDVVYECGIDFRHERMWNEKSDAGTFNNKIHSTAKVRIPDGYRQGIEAGVARSRGRVIKYTKVHKNT